MIFRCNDSFTFSFPLLSGSGLSLAELQSAAHNGMKGTRLQHSHGNEDVDVNHWGGMERGWGAGGSRGGITGTGGEGKVLSGGRNSVGKLQVVEGETLLLKKVSRLQMGSYLCIASNGIPPSVSKRAHLKVQCMCLYQFFHSRAPLLSQFVSFPLTALASICFPSASIRQSLTLS